MPLHPSKPLVKILIYVIPLQNNLAAHSNTLLKCSCTLCSLEILIWELHPRNIILKWKPNFVHKDVNYIITCIGKTQQMTEVFNNNDRFV